MARKSKFAPVAEVAVPEKETIWKVGIYTRLSVEDGDDVANNSLGNQKKLAMEFLKKREDMLLFDTYMDNGFSGMNFNRPDFHRMMDDLQRCRINCILIKDISRLGRHFILTSEYVQKIFPEMNVRLISVIDEYDSICEISSTTELVMPLKMVMNDSFVRDISKRIRSSITAKMNAGEFLPSQSSIPYGYLRDPENNTFTIDEETAPIIQRIYKMRANGMSFIKIARDLDLDGIPSPGRIRFERGYTKRELYRDSLWATRTVRKICEDPVYLGHRIHGKVKREKLGMDKKRRPEQEWQIIEGAHLPIIEQELYDQVQKINEEMRKRRAEYKTAPGLNVDRGVFSGTIFCADCGAPMRALKGVDRNMNSHCFYDCNEYFKSKKLKCKSHYIRYETVMAALRGVLYQQVLTAVDFDQYLQQVKKSAAVSSHQRYVQDQLNSVRIKIRNTDEKIDRLLVDLTQGLIDKESYSFAKTRYAEIRDDLLEEEKTLVKEAGTMGDTIEIAQTWIDAVKKYQDDWEITKETVDFLVSRIEVSSNDEIRIVLAYEDPFKILSDDSNISKVVENHAG